MKNTKQCSCFRLFEPLPDEETLPESEKWRAQLPDHVCYMTQVMTCGWWIYHRAGSLPAETPENPKPLCTALADGRFMLTNPKHGFIQHWSHSEEEQTANIVLVIQQWVEGHRDEKLACWLKEHPGWKKLLMDFDNSLLQSKDPDDDCGDLRITANGAFSIMGKYGIPITPGTIWYVINEANHGKSEDIDYSFVTPVPPTNGPTAGMLITTFCIEPEMPGSRADTVYEIGGSSAYLSSPLFTRAFKVIKAHSEWWQNLNKQSVPSFEGRRYNQGRGPNVELRADVAAYLRNPDKMTLTMLWLCCTNSCEASERRIERSGGI